MTQDLRTCTAWTALLSCRNHLLGHANCLVLAPLVAAEAGVCVQVANKDYFNIEERWVVRLNEAWCCDTTRISIVHHCPGHEEATGHQSSGHREAV